MEETKTELDSLVDFVSEISSLPGNEWLRNAIIERILPKTLAATPHHSSEIISRIYEYCIKEIIQNQANKFYENFCFTSIKEQLVKDFIRMEGYRRQDDFENFSLAIFQQFENVLNYAFTLPATAELLRLKGDRQVLLRYDKDINGYVPTGKMTLYGLISKNTNDEIVRIIKNKELSSWTFIERLRLITYLYVFNSTIRGSNEEFYKYCDSIHTIYLIRNLNHRGGSASIKQSEVINEVLPRSHRYYLKFMGLLEDFIVKIDSSDTLKLDIHSVKNTVG